MAHSQDVLEQRTKIAELKRLITSRAYETLDELEDAVDALLWGDEESSQLPDQMPAEQLS